MDERDLNKTTVPLGKSETHNPPFPKDTHCVNVQNDVWDVLNFEIMKALKKENEELSKKLTKYKKAFEILKEKNIKPYYKENRNGKEYYLGTLGWCCIITKKQYELLEELMNTCKKE